MDQLTLSDYLLGRGYTHEDTAFVEPPEMRIDKPIRLIELFAGIGSQAMALRDLGADFEHYRAVEIEPHAVKSYNAIHGTDFEPTDITKLHGSDLGITETDKFCYILTYSFPCTDLSRAGRMMGMEKGSGTRSGLLWEVERLLTECKELADNDSNYGLPAVCLMENVTEVHRDPNRISFNRWRDFLEGLGYSNYFKDLNARYYGVAQNRDRTFMVSFLGRWSYEWPTEIELRRCMKDYLDDVVDESYYLNTERAAALIERIENERKEDAC